VPSTRQSRAGGSPDSNPQHSVGLVFRADNRHHYREYSPRSCPGCGPIRSWFSPLFDGGDREHRGQGQSGIGVRSGFGGALRCTWTCCRRKRQALGQVAQSTKRGYGFQPRRRRDAANRGRRGAKRSSADMACTANAVRYRKGNSAPPRANGSLAPEQLLAGPVR